MKRADTRYKGVWDAAHESAMHEANAILVRAIRGGFEFALHDARWDMNMVAVRRHEGPGWRVTEVPAEALLEVLDVAMRRGDLA